MALLGRRRGLARALLILDIDEANGNRVKIEANSLDYPLFKLEKQ